MNELFLAYNRKSFRKAAGLAAAVTLFAGTPAFAADQTGKVEKADPLASTATEVAQPLTVVANKSTILRLESPAARISVGNPAVADITPINPREIYVLGKSIGATNLIVWSKNGVAKMIDVNVIAEPVMAPPIPEDKDTVEVIKGLDKSQMQF